MSRNVNNAAPVIRGQPYGGNRTSLNVVVLTTPSAILSMTRLTNSPGNTGVTRIVPDMPMACASPVAEMVL